ncbi:hypothetical protein ACFX1R_006792 [Malus domestica]
MANWVLSECGLKPLPQVWNRPITVVCSSYPSKVWVFRSNQNSAYLRWDSTKMANGLFREKRWGLNVSAPLRVASVDEEEERVNGVNGDGDGEYEVGFDPGAPPPFKLADVKTAIPKHCWVRDLWRSMNLMNNKQPWPSLQITVHHFGVELHDDDQIQKAAEIMREAVDLYFIKIFINTSLTREAGRKDQIQAEWRNTRRAYW